MVDVEGPESVIQSEVRQKGKNVYVIYYAIIMHICEIWKNATGEPVCRAGIEMQMQRTDDEDTEGRGEGETNGDRRADTYTAAREKAGLVGSRRRAPGAQLGALR